MKKLTLAAGLIGVSFLGCTSSETPPPSSPPRSVGRYSVADLYKNSQFSGASFCADGRKVLVSSNRSGIWNAYAVPVDGGEPEPLTQSTTDSIFAASCFPDDDRFLYTSDQGGNELSHVFVRQMDGTTKDLTPGAKVNAQFAGWAHDEASFFVSSNARDSRYFDLYRYTTDGHASTIFYRNTKGFDLGPVSRDQRYMALVKSRTTNDSDIWLVDRQKGTTSTITPHQGDVSNAPADFSPDGTKLLFISDAGREFQALRSHDLVTGEQKALLEPSWDVMSASYSKSGKYLIVQINENAATTSHLFDAETMQEVNLTGMPQGLVRGLRLSRDDARLAFYGGDGSAPDDLYVGSIGQRSQASDQRPQSGGATG